MAALLSAQIAARGNGLNDSAGAIAQQSKEHLDDGVSFELLAGCVLPPVVCPFCLSFDTCTCLLALKIGFFQLQASIRVNCGDRRRGSEYGVQ